MDIPKNIVLGIIAALKEGSTCQSYCSIIVPTTSLHPAVVTRAATICLLHLQVEGMNKQAPASARAMVPLLEYLARVLLQDACALLSSNCEAVKKAAEANPVHKELLSWQEFRSVDIPGVRVSE